MMPMQWNTLTKCASVPVWNPKIRLLTKIFVVSVDWNFVWKDSIGMTWYVELIINNRKYSIISPDRIGYCYSCSMGCGYTDFEERRDSDETKRAIGDVDSSIFLLPYPESETVQNPLLKADPMPYAFKEDRITDLFN